MLAACFIAALVSCNLIFQKFFVWQPLSGVDFAFEISVGILPYPITFLITDLISEIFGKRKANQVVISGLFAAIFALLIITVADAVPATSWSPINDDLFHRVFGFTGIAVAASMLAYIFAQFIDVRLFHFWKKLTRGKHLWIRNNFSTIGSQLVDTLSVVGLLCLAGVISWEQFPSLFISGFLFKVLVAVLDTPILYLLVFTIRRKFALQAGEEISLDGFQG
ncbi:MAG: queuosine precursor transporter [Luteibaculum sp.]